MIRLSRDSRSRAWLSRALVGGSHHGDAVAILEHLRLAKQAGLWVFVRISVGRHNHDEIARIRDLASEIGVDVVQIKPWIAAGLFMPGRILWVPIFASHTVILIDASSSREGSLRGEGRVNAQGGCRPLGPRIPTRESRGVGIRVPQTRRRFGGRIRTR